MLVLLVGATHEAHPSPRFCVCCCEGVGHQQRFHLLCPNLPTGNRLHLNPYWTSLWKELPHSISMLPFKVGCSGSRTTYQMDKRRGT